MLFGTRYFLSQVKQFGTFHHILKPSYVCLVTGLGGYLYMAFFPFRTYMSTCNLVFCRRSVYWFSCSSFIHCLFTLLVSCFHYDMFFSKPFLIFVFLWILKFSVRICYPHCKFVNPHSCMPRSFTDFHIKPKDGIQ